MSLLDDVSIVVTPNGYKAGELYAVVPVPTEGAEEVTNGDFATDSDWTKGTGWTISGGNGVLTSGSGILTQTLSGVIVSSSYKLSWETGLNFQVRLGGANIGYFSGSNSLIISSAAGTLLEFLPNGTQTGTIDNISVKEVITASADMDVTRATAATRVDENGLVNYAEVVTGSDIVTNGDFSNGSTDWTLQNGWSLGSNDVEFNTSVSAYRKLFQENFLTIGSHYKLTFEIKSISAGSIANFGYSGSFDTIGVKTQIFTAIYDDLYLEPTNDAVLTIDNIKVEEVTRDNVPRIDYTGGGCPHILAEPQRTNLITYSEDFSNADWQKVKSSVTSGFSSPDGGNNAYIWQEDTNSGVHSLKELYSFTSVDYSQTIFIKPNGRSNVLLWVDGASKGTRFDLSSGTIYSETSSVGKITAMNDGWF